MAERLVVSPRMSEAQEQELGGHLLGADACPIVLKHGDYDVYAETGEILLKLRANALSKAVCRVAYGALLKAAGKTENRGYAAGGSEDDRTRKAADSSSLRYKPLKKDGTVSKTDCAPEVNSGIVGYFDRNPRFPFCRTTAFTRTHVEKWAQCKPLFEEVDALFAETMPERYRAQRAMADATNQDFVIAGTAFTTITVNRNWQTAVHQDAGDLKDGFGVLTAMRSGHFAGGVFCLPRYGVGADLYTGDVLFADVHRWHGNTPILGYRGKFNRLSLVFYYREKMAKCGSAEQEFLRAKARAKGTPIY